MRAETLQRIEQERALQRAVEDSQFHLLYQPIVALTSDRVVGVEALLRRHHPDRGTVPPAEFIPLAEETGLIEPIGTWVLEEAARQSVDWARSFPGVSLGCPSASLPGSSRPRLCR
jgi:EAL domain-containing protein (putative c-di-GMP-specific phosphodiesterase class I)